MAVFSTLALITTLLSFARAGFPSRRILDVEETAKAVFYDFGKTLTVMTNSGIFGACETKFPTPIGPTFSRGCIGDGKKAFDVLPPLLHLPQTQTDNLITTLEEEFPVDFVLEDMFGGQERVDQLIEHLETVRASGAKMFIVSTGYWDVTPKEWKDFILYCLTEVGLKQFFMDERVFTLYDAGEGKYVQYIVTYTKHKKHLKQLRSYCR